MKLMFNISDMELYEIYLKGYDNAIQFGYMPDIKDKYQAAAYSEGFKDGKISLLKTIDMFYTHFIFVY